MLSNSTGKLIRRFRQTKHGDTTSRVVFFPHAGGSASYFSFLANLLECDVDAVSLQYPGRQDRRNEAPIEDIGKLTNIIADAIEEMPPKPTVFFGHSMGAIVAFETVLRLEGSAHSFQRHSLIVSGRRAPSAQRDQTVHMLDDNELLSEIKSLGGTDTAVVKNEEIIRMTLPTIRSDYKLIENYSSSTNCKVECPVAALFGASDPKTTSDEAIQWGDHTNAPFRFRSFDGGHFFLTAHESAVCSEISGQLAKLKCL